MNNIADNEYLPNTKIKEIQGQFSPALLRALWQIDQDRLRLEGDLGSAGISPRYTKPPSDREV
jgi:hypothetical protein